MQPLRPHDGLTAKKHTLLDVEDAAEFDLFLNATLDQFRPNSLFTRQLDDSLANINWRKTRLKLIETNYFNYKIAEHLGGNSPDPLAAAAAGTGEIAALVRSRIESAGPAGPLELLRRYIATLTHEFNTTLNNL